MAIMLFIALYMFFRAHHVHLNEGLLKVDLVGSKNVAQGIYTVSHKIKTPNIDLFSNFFH